MKTKKIVNISTKIIWALVILLLIGLGIARIILYSQDAMNKKLEIFFDLISALCVIASIAFTGRSLSDNKDVQLATFIKDLNTNFNANDKNIQAYDLLCSCIHDKCQYCKNCKGKTKECCKRIPDEKEGESLLSNYFSFFGTVYVLLSREIIKMDFVNELFSFRFFIAAHSKIMQEARLNNPEFNFKDIFELEQMWIKYRIDHEMITEDQYRNAIDLYRKVRKGEISEEEANKVVDTIYLRRPLASLFDTDQEYKKYLEKPKYKKKSKKVYKNPDLF